MFHILAPCPCFMSISLCCLPMLHVRAACPCCLSKLLVRVTCSCGSNMLHVQIVCQLHVHVSMLLVHAAFPCSMSMLQSILHTHAACPCYLTWSMSILYAHVSMLHLYAACPCSITICSFCKWNSLWIMIFRNSPNLFLFIAVSRCPCCMNMLHNYL